MQVIHSLPSWTKAIHHSVSDQLPHAWIWPMYRYYWERRPVYNDTLSAQIPNDLHRCIDADTRRYTFSLEELSRKMFVTVRTRAGCMSMCECCWWCHYCRVLQSAKLNYQTNSIRNSTLSLSSNGTDLINGVSILTQSMERKTQQKKNNKVSSGNAWLIVPCERKPF